MGLTFEQYRFELCRWKKSTCNPLTCGLFSINAVALHHLQLFESKIGSRRSAGAVMGLHPQNLVYTASPGSSLPRVPRVYCYGWMCVYKNKHLCIYTHTHVRTCTHTHIVLDIVILRSIFFKLLSFPFLNVTWLENTTLKDGKTK